MKCTILSLSLLISLSSVLAMHKKGVGTSVNPEETQKMISLAAERLIQTDKKEVPPTQERPRVPLVRAQSEPIPIPGNPRQRPEYDFIGDESPVSPAAYNTDQAAAHGTSIEKLRRSSGSCRDLLSGEFRGWKYYRSLKEDANQ